MFKNGFLEKSKKVLFGSGALTKYLPTYFKNQKYSPSFILKHEFYQSFDIMAAITMVLSQDVGLFPIIHERKNLGNHSLGIC